MQNIHFKLTLTYSSSIVGLDHVPFSTVNLISKHNIRNFSLNLQTEGQHWRMSYKASPCPICKSDLSYQEISAH